MIKQYLINGKQWQFEESKAPEGAVLVEPEIMAKPEKKAEPKNKAKITKNKSK